jgi:hypothetical protein
MRAIRPVVVVLVIAATSGGCAAIGLAVIGTGLGIAAGTGTAYTLDGIAYRTFAAPMDQTRGAALRTLRRMDITVQKDDVVGEGRAIVAAAGDRTVYIDLEKLTSRTTRMRVTAKQGWFWRDRSTAGEIVAQTADAIDESPALSQRGRKS